MLLSSSNGNQLEMGIAGYQFVPAANTSDGWDENWLIISGRVRLNAETWEFSDPCLTTWEATDLLDWLRGAVHAPPRPIEFTEPNLSFEARIDDDSQPTVVITLKGEAAPPGVSEDIRWGTGSTLQLHLSPKALHDATDSWANEVARYPSR